VYPSTIKWNKIRGHKNNFCSINCRKEYYKGENSPNWVGGKSIARNGYVRVFTPTEKCGFRYEHRIVIEKSIGRRLNKGEQIHHINGIKHDNRLENLKLVSPLEHKKYHPSEKGENSNSNKLRQVQVDEIRKKYKTGKYTLLKLAKKYNVCFQNISLIVNNKTWV
jgi:hypothetical protein